MLALEPRMLLTGTPIISEFLASNSGGLQDADGESSDWIELYNPTGAAIDLAGWSLTDNPGDLNQWQFPDVTLGANQFLTVLASGKNRTSGPELHTNFKLSAAGEYLALVDPGLTVISQFSPSFPAQVNNISYGVGFDTAKLIQPGAPAKVLVPADGSLGANWTGKGFDAASWTTGSTGVGYGVVQPGFSVTYMKANVFVDNLDVARNVVDDPGLRSQTVYSNAPVVNYMGSGGGSNFGNELPFPTQSIGEDIDDFVIQAKASVKIPAAGSYTFGVNSDDGFELKLERNGVTFTSEYFGPRGPADTLATFSLPEGGDWNISLIMYERGGGASVELFAAAGAWSDFGSGPFHLVGDTAGGGLAAYSAIGAGSTVTVGTDIGAAMHNVNSTAYIRVPFTVANPAAFDALALKMRYDDGFVAYLNGVEVARRNAPASLAFNSAATADRTLIDATTAETINLTPFLSALQSGNNVLAIQGLNSSAGDDSFLILPELTASAVHPDQTWYFETVTPGDPNLDPAIGIVERVVASVPAGFYNTTQIVSLSVPSPGAVIRYTTDGSAPTPTNGTLYVTPISVTGTTTLRAQAFRTDYISLPSITRTYIFVDDVIAQSPSDDVAGGAPDVGAPPAGWPAAWGNNMVDYGIDQTVVQQEGADKVKAALLALPSISITTDLANLFDPVTGIYANAYNDGRDWERPASIELLNPDGTPGFQVNAGLRIRGGYSRSGGNPKHAFRLFFRSEYGDSSLEYPMFGTEGVDSFKKLDLRTAQNYSWSFGGDPSNTMIQDNFERLSQGAMGEPYTRSRWYNLYIDGQYWGVYETQERAEADFAASYFGGSASNYDVIKPEAGPYTIYATDGNLDAFRRLWQAVTTQDLTSNSVYYHLQGKDADGKDDPGIPNDDVLLDVDNLVVYMIGILHGGNLDAPISWFLGNQGVNNFFALRDRTGREGFKYFQHDGEHTLHNIYEDRNGPFPAGADFDRFNPQFLHQQLMANDEYRLKFADAVEKYFFNDGAMTVAQSQERFQTDVDALDQAIIAESARWGDAQRPNDPLTRANWLAAVNGMLDFLANRNPILLQQFRDHGLFPNLAAPQYLVNGAPQNAGEVIPGSLLRFSAGAGLVYYTTDGSDPRLVGGAINPLAQIYDPGSISSTLVAAGSSWKYFDQGTNLGTGWRASAFDDSGWSSGNAELGYGDGDEATTVGFGPNAGAKFVTTYFRKVFTVSDPAAVTGLLLKLKRDDGAVVYINGVEAARSNMPGGTVGSSTLAAGAVGGGDEQTFFEFSISPALLLAGNNVIAVEIHQSSPDSSDISFDAELVASSQSNVGLVLNASAHLKARAFDGIEWSPLEEAVFSTAIPAAAGNFVVTEINYNPAAEPGATTAPLNDSNNFEFIELRNTSDKTINLAGVRFTKGISFDFSTGDMPFFAAGQSLVVVKNREAFEHRYGTGIPITGVYTGSLDNGGEQLTLVDAAGATIQDFTYDDDQKTTPPWPASADGGGFSLTVRDVAGNYNLPANWRPSHLANGTPGYDENDNPSSLSLAQNPVGENEPGAVVGTLSATDPNPGETFTFEILPGEDGALFALSGKTLKVGPIGLDYEAGATRKVKIRVTDSGGLFLDKTFTISVLDVPEDTLPPVSAVAGLPAFTGALTFLVQWSGSDGPSGTGVALYDVYYSDNGAAYHPFVTGTPETSKPFSGQNGHHYAFYSIATDGLGNVESAPVSPDAATTLDVTAPTSTVSPLPATIYSPGFVVSWSGSDNAGGSGLAHYDVFVSDNGGPFQPLVSDTTDLSALFTGQVGHTYAFYSVASDAVGNQQAAPAGGQTSTTVTATLPFHAPAAIEGMYFTSDGQLAYVLRDGDELSFVNGAGQTSPGHVDSPVQLSASAWNLNAVFDPQLARLAFSDGAVWNKVRQLAGRWMNQGAIDTGIRQLGTELTFTSAQGAVTVGRYVSATQVAAPGWSPQGDLLGQISADGTKIQWANGNSWTVVPTLAGNYANQDGLPTRLEQFGTSLVFVNRLGKTSTGKFIDPTHVVQLDWGGVVGTIQNGEIDWSNGVRWLPASIPAGRPDLGGLWDVAGGVDVRILQAGETLTFVNRYGDSTPGHFVSNTEVFVDAWGTGGKLSGEGNTLSLTSGKVWTRLPDLSGPRINQVQKEVGVNQLERSLWFTTDSGVVIKGRLVSPTRLVETEGLQRGGTIQTGLIAWDDGRAWRSVADLRGNWTQTSSAPTYTLQAGLSVLFVSETGATARAQFMNPTQLLTNAASGFGQASIIVNVDTPQRLTFGNGWTWAKTAPNSLDAVFADPNLWPFIG